MSGPDRYDLTDEEVEQAARKLIAEYGVDAEALAEMRVAEMLESKNTAGVVAWARILQTIQDIQATESKPS